jgi:hypothetical protein
MLDLPAARAPGYTDEVNVYDKAPEPSKRSRVTGTERTLPATAGGPEILRFKARLGARSKEAKADAGAVLSIPGAVGRLLDGMESAEGTINGHPFRAALDRAASGGLALRVNQAMLRGAGARSGDTVQLAILGPEPKLVVPSDLRTAMARSEPAKSLWKDMSDLARRDYVRWVEATNNPETRARRVKRTVEQLAEGKRRPCCVNTYEYPLSLIDPNWPKKKQAKR